MHKLIMDWLAMQRAECRLYAWLKVLCAVHRRKGAGDKCTMLKEPFIWLHAMIGYVLVYIFFAGKSNQAGGYTRVGKTPVFRILFSTLTDFFCPGNFSGNGD